MTDSLPRVRNQPNSRKGEGRCDCPNDGRASMFSILPPVQGNHQKQCSVAFGPRKLQWNGDKVCNISCGSARVVDEIDECGDGIVQRQNGTCLPGVVRAFLLHEPDFAASYALLVAPILLPWASHPKCRALCASRRRMVHSRWCHRNRAFARFAARLPRCPRHRRPRMRTFRRRESRLQACRL
jgi:hypothetical protein